MSGKMSYAEGESDVYAHDLTPYGEEEWGELFATAFEDFGLRCSEESVETFYMSTEGIDVFCLGQTDEGYSEDEEEGEYFTFGDGGIGGTDESCAVVAVLTGAVVGGEGFEVLIESGIWTMSGAGSPFGVVHCDCDDRVT